MAFEIIRSDPAIRQLKKPDRSVARPIFDQVGELAETPHRYVQKLVNSPYYRLRVGDYRVILDIQGVFRGSLCWRLDIASQSTSNEPP